MKIIHTADWHIGQLFFGYERTQEHQHFLDWLLARIAETEIDVLLICGDVFDVANPSAQAQRQVYRFLRKATEKNPGLQIIMIAGNHDSATRLETPVPLLEDRHTHVRGVINRDAEGNIRYEELIVELKNRRGEREGWCLTVPYLRQGDYPAMPDDEHPYRAGVKQMYANLLEIIQQRRNPKEAVIALGHLQATGSRLSEDDTSERLIIGGLEGIPGDTFSREITYTALGHIHREQQVDKRKEVHYAGSPLPMSFAEEHYEHGVIYLETKEGKITHFQKLAYTPLAKLLRIPATPRPLEEVLEELTQLPDGLPDEHAPYLEVRILLTAPEPALRSRVEEALQGKHVRLTRVLPFYPETTTVNLTTTPSLSTEELMNPRKIVHLTYAGKYGVEMPAELDRLFDEITEEALRKIEEKS